MDCVIPTNDRPVRLACLLASLLPQQWNGVRRLYLVDNSAHDVSAHPPVSKMVAALDRCGWTIEHLRSRATSCTEIKIEALQCGTDRHIILIDNDILFTRHDTIAALEYALTRYDVAAASPVAYDLDEDRAVLTPYIDAYDRDTPDSHGIVEGTIALGACMAFVRDDLEVVLAHWAWRLPYMEDQVLAHFLKRSRGYAYLRRHVVLHWGKNEAPAYQFDDDEVVRHLEELNAVDGRWAELLDLRRALRDGADFPKQIVRR
jgi:hypothetical protein